MISMDWPFEQALWVMQAFLSLLVGTMMMAVIVVILFLPLILSFPLVFLC
jgi:hypothetical protein